MNDFINIYTDGGARGNPGPAAVGVYITDLNNKEIAVPSLKSWERRVIHLLL